MEHVKGVPLYDKWATMSGNQQLEFIIGILEIVKRRWQQWNFRRMVTCILPTLLLNLHLSFLKCKTMSLDPTADPDIGIAILVRKGTTAQ